MFTSGQIFSQLLCGNRRDSLASSHEQLGWYLPQMADVKLEVPVRKIIAAGVLAFCGLMTIGVGTSHADEYVFPADYQTEAGCLADGPHVEGSVPQPPPPGQAWKTFNCVYEDRGNGVGASWYLHVESGPA
jgi:hypothetical protein